MANQPQIAISGGLRLLRYGSLHGSVLGLEVVLANGQVRRKELCLVFIVCFVCAWLCAVLCVCLCMCVCVTVGHQNNLCAFSFAYARWSTCFAHAVVCCKGTNNV